MFYHSQNCTTDLFLKAAILFAIDSGCIGDWLEVRIACCQRNALEGLSW
jgi:hypothetical protein